VGLSDDPTALVTVHNRFGNSESCELPEFAVAVYDVIMGSELLQQWDSHRNIWIGLLNTFQKNMVCY
jgi:hypothetical protein